MNLIQEFFSFEKINYCGQLLNSEQEKVFQKNFKLLLDAIESSSLLAESNNFLTKNNFQSNSFSSQILEPIFNCTWGDLSWDIVNKTQGRYIQELEEIIDNFYETKKKVIKIFFDFIIQIYNDILEKQEFYQQEV